MSDDEWTKEQQKVIDDLKLSFRHEQITTEGNDPAKTGESFGTPHDLAVIAQQPAGEEGCSPEGGFPGAGRPTESGTYGTDQANMGRDPLGKQTDISRDSTYHNFRKGPMAVESQTALKSSLKKMKVKTKSMIIESLKPESKTEELGLLDESQLLDDTI